MNMSLVPKLEIAIGKRISSAFDRIPSEVVDEALQLLKERDETSIAQTRPAPTEIAFVKRSVSHE